MLQKAILPLVLLSCILLPTQAADLVAKKVGDKIEVTRVGNPKPIVTQNARSDFRPYLHPIVAPDGKGELTEYSPCLLYTSPSPRDLSTSRMPSSA